jgi:hypothetical protein
LTTLNLATIPAGETSVDVPYTLSYLPQISDFYVTPQDDLSGRTFWVDTLTSSTFRININSLDISDHTFGWFINQPSAAPPALGNVDVTADLDTVRGRVGLTATDIVDADVLKYVTEACEFINDQIAGTIDETDCMQAEAEAIRNLAAIKCFFDVTGASSTGWTANIGIITFSGSPEKIAMINYLWARVKEFVDRRHVNTVQFKVGAANY